MKRSLTIALLGLVLAGSSISCAGSLYRPHNGRLGYSEAEVSPNVFEVYFEGSERMSMGSAKQYARARAAELTLARGMSHFRVLSAGNSSRVQVDRRTDYVDRGYDHRGRDLGTDQITYNDVYSQPVAVLTIEMLSEPADDAFLAQQVYDESVASGIIPVEED